LITCCLFVGERNQIEERNKESGFCVRKLLTTTLTSKKTLLLKSEVFMKKENCTGMDEGKIAMAFASVCFSFLGDNQWK